MADARIALVTGAASGIGRATAQRLAADGDLVVVADLNEAAGHAVVAEIRRAGGTAEFRAIDVALEESVSECAQRVENELGPVAVLVNSAGVLQNVADIASFSLEEHDKLWAINYRGTYLCCRAFAPRMAARRSGSIVNISSTSALGAMPLLAYGPGKAAVQNLTAILAVELGPDNVRVNAVVPGYVLTEQMQARIDAGKRDPRSMRLHSALGRMVAPEDIANGIHFLCSDAASCITGIALPIDAGYLAAVTYLHHPGLAGIHPRREDKAPVA
ncbi:MAG TPA: SDR family oxidoreductase [Casimicrobiaceae bacterium]|nr:SDR family oxidoreductase [Casimicrobiaceae bacterium]